MEEPRPLTEGLDALMRSLRNASSSAIGGLFGRWEEAVGPTVAAHARPLRLDGTHLVVEVDEPIWATQLKLLESQLTERLQDVAAVSITTIEVRVAGARARRR